MGSLDRTSKQSDVPDEGDSAKPEQPTLVVGKFDDPYDPGRLARGDDKLDESDELDDQRRSKYEQLLETVKDETNLQHLESVGEEAFRLAEGRLPDRVEPSGTHVGTPDRPAVYRASREELQGGEIAIAPVVIWLLGHYVVEKLRGKRPTGEADGGD